MNSSDNMGISTIKIMSFVVIFVSIFSIAGYACSYSFCSSLACTSDCNCHDTCEGGFWYSGNKICSSDCYFSSSKHCKFEKKTCADSNSTDNFPIIGGSVKTCNAECDQNTDCKDKCVGNVRYHSGSCNLTSTCNCSYTTQNCDLQDNCYIYGNGCEDRDYFCQVAGCNYTFSNRSVDSYDNYVNYCSADTIRTHRTFHDFSCDGTCKDHTSWVNDSFVQGCNLQDGWYNTTTTQWVSTGQCAEKEQLYQDERDYTCSDASCTFSVIDHRWIDTGQTRNKEDETACNDDLYCTVNDVCLSGQCSGSSRDCFANNLPETASCDNDSDNNPFTFDYSQAFTSVCDEINDQCTEGSQTLTNTCADVDSTDNFPIIGELVRTCTAECDQNTDCSCPASGCVNNDYYDYPNFGACNESCRCNCEPTITANDPLCVESFIEVNKTVETTELNCQGTSIVLVVNGFGAGIVGTNVTITDFLPAYVSLEDNLTDGCEYDNSTRKITCNLSDVSAGDTKLINFNVSLTQLGNVLIDVYPESGVSYVDHWGNSTFVSFPETYVNVLGYSGATEICNDGIDNNCNSLIDCSDSHCTSDSHCVQPIPAPSGIMGVSGGGGGTISIPAVCGNSKCEYGETCSSCPKDCLKQEQICCDKIAFDGNCCIDYDCGEGYECTMTKKCQPLYVENETTGGNQTICKEDWICTDWSECVNGNQARTCVDSNSCNTNLNKPEESRQCEVSTGPTGLFLFLTSALGLFSIISTIILILLVLFRKRIGAFFKKGTSVVNYEQSPVKDQTENL